MMKNITMGQFYPVDSLVHRLDPRMKIILAAMLIVSVFLVRGLLGYGLVLAFVYLSARLSNVPFRMLLGGLKPLRFILILTFLLNLFFNNGQTVLLHWQFITLTAEGLSTAVHYSLRLTFLVLGTSLLTLTTSPVALADGIELLFGPLKRIHFPAHELAMMMTIALRFIPTLIEETDKIMSAQKARGADLESGGLMQRARALVPILIPLFVSSFRRADELALAMECRCYRGGEGRTRMKQLHLSAGDGVASGVMIACIAGVIALNLLLP